MRYMVVYVNLSRQISPSEADFADQVGKLCRAKPANQARRRPAQSPTPRFTVDFKAQAREADAPALRIGTG
jgi:hypothetical protein